MVRNQTWCNATHGLSPVPGGFAIHERLNRSGRTTPIGTGTGFRRVVRRQFPRGADGAPEALSSRRTDCVGVAGSIFLVLRRLRRDRGLTTLLLRHQSGLALAGRWRWGRREFLGDRHGGQHADDVGWPLQRSLASDGRLANSENLGPHRGLQASQLTLPP
jgi:hypothetical protein